MPLLNLRGVNATYGTVQVLWDINLEMDEGEIVTIIGPNGSGKTTLLKVIAGLIKPSSGAVEFNGERIDGKPSHEIVKKGICYVPEGRRVFPDMSVLENLELGAYLEKSRRMKNQNLKRVFEIFPVLEKKKKEMAGTLSGGEMQMLSIARGLMGMPRLLLLDEPSLGLAPIVISKIFEVIKRINSEGVSVLVVEQNVFQSLKISSRAYLLEVGKIVHKGFGSELLNDDYVKKSYLGR